MLDTAAKFQSYRGNLLLIGAQASASHPGRGFLHLAERGPPGTQGGAGIAILAPCTYRPTAADRAEPAGPAAPAGQEPATTSGGGVAPQGGGGGRQVRAFGWCPCSTRYPEIAVPGLSFTASPSALSIVAGARVLRRNRAGRPASSPRPVSR